jgi:hypothetical protein
MCEEYDEMSPCIAVRMLLVVKYHLHNSLLYLLA